jgi:hypothetical protein
MSVHTMAVVAGIRPGKRAELAQLLEGGPPFDLPQYGFTRHQALLGDHTVVFIFEGERAMANLRNLAGSLPLRPMMNMGRLVEAPQVLSEGYDWSPTPLATNSA